MFNVYCISLYQVLCALEKSYPFVRFIFFLNYYSSIISLYQLCILGLSLQSLWVIKMSIFNSITSLIDVWVFGICDSSIWMDNYVIFSAIYDSISLRCDYPLLISTLNQNITICEYPYLAIFLNNYSLVLLVFVFMAVYFGIFIITEKFILSHTENEIVFDRIQ